MTQRESIPYPAYAPILLTIESIIHFMDEAAKQAGVVWTDAQVIGVIHQVSSLAKGREVKLDFSTLLRDQMLMVLYQRLVQTPALIFEEIQQSDGTIEKRPLRNHFWRGCLNTIVHAARLHRDAFAGNRRYLDHLKISIANTRHERLTGPAKAVISIGGASPGDWTARTTRTGQLWPTASGR